VLSKNKNQTNGDTLKESVLKNLFAKYDEYKAVKINSDFITYAELQDELGKLKNNPLFDVEMIGESIEQRKISRIRVGAGKTKILVWSQMHGDEPTATAVLLDLFNFLSASDSFKEFRKLILTELEIHFIPMLNPDGAERFQRENAINIDINRDAIKLSCDESRVLWNYALKLKPEFGFNLHDQNSYYTAGRKNKSSAISLLTPPMDFVKSINYTREKGMQIILKIFEALSIFVPEHIARYSDEFEPRAFGDNFVKQGISSILIESGFYPGDFKKDFVRKLNFISILTAFNSIVEKDHEKLFYADYFEIPENKEMLFDLLLKNLQFNFKERNFSGDVGINRKKIFNPVTKEFFFEGQIAGVGDLSTFWGNEEHDLSGYQVSSPEQLKVDTKLDFDLIKDRKVGFRINRGILHRINN
jgi:hypothetical protein